MKRLVYIHLALRDREWIVFGIGKTYDTIPVDTTFRIGRSQIRVGAVSHQVEKAVEFEPQFHSSFMDDGKPHLALRYGGDGRQKPGWNGAEAV